MMFQNTLKNDAFKNIESIVKLLSDEAAIKRALRLNKSADVKSEEKHFFKSANSKAYQGFSDFKRWVESAGQNRQGWTLF